MIKTVGQPLGICLHPDSISHISSWESVLWHDQNWKGAQMLTCVLAWLCLSPLLQSRQTLTLARVLKCIVACQWSGMAKT